MASAISNLPSSFESAVFSQDGGSYLRQVDIPFHCILPLAFSHLHALSAHPSVSPCGSGPQ